MTVTRKKVSPYSHDGVYIKVFAVGVHMDTLISTLIFGLSEDETYSWDDMERCGWQYNGVNIQNVETLEMWKQGDFLALSTLDGKVVSIYRVAR